MARSTNAPVAFNSKSKSIIRTGINTLLPPELLALAFSFPVTDAVGAISFKAPGGPDEGEVQRWFGRHPLWNASLVCRAWHASIKDTPRFWTFVAVGFTSPARPSASTSDRPATATSESPHRKERLRGIEILLERSGRLPLTVVLCPENIQDLLSISQALHKHFDRLEILSLVASDNLEPRRRGRRQTPSRTTLDQALGLITGPMPNLKLISISRCLKPIMYGLAGRFMSVHREVDAPHLETLSCHTHLIIPESPIRISLLSLTSVDFDQFARRSIELPHLLDLRIQYCNPGAILSTFLTPSLRRLVVQKGDTSSAPAQLPSYDGLQELQWRDTGEDPVFVMLSRLCPNLKRYFNYIKADRIEEDIRMAKMFFPEEFESPPMIFSAFDRDVLGGVNVYRNWPVLEEVSLNGASCDHIAKLIKAVPSIRRIRVLRDPVLFSLSCDDDDDEEGIERDKLVMLRGKVEIAIGSEPWGYAVLVSSVTEINAWFCLVRMRYVIAPTFIRVVFHPTTGHTSQSPGLGAPKRMDINEVIPPELLLSILDYLYAEAIASIPLTPPKPPPLDHHPLLDMMLVCRSWHQVIIGNPTFWKFIWIGAGTGQSDPDGIWLKGVLRRSGQLSLSVMIAPESVAQFRAVEQTLVDECHRIGTLTLVRMDERVEGMPSAEDVQQFLQHPFPSLKRLSVGNTYTSTDPEQSSRIQIMVNSPQLQELFSHYHFIFPKSPSYLTSISLTSVYPFPNSPSIPSTFELPSLLDLRISDCDPSAFLSAFVTPSLRKLCVIDDVPASGPVPPLRLYPSLEEVQWTDRGPDRTFSAFLPLCPNLARYSNYQVGLEKEIKFQFIDTPATVLSLLPGQLGDNGAPSNSSWPNLEEVLLDVGTCEEISTLVHAIPSLKRVRILQNFTTRLEDEAQQREIKLLPSLRKLVDVAFWLDPWGSNLGMHFGEREGV